MTTRLFRILVALALALAVPIQGAAAATAGLCMGLGHHDAGAAASDDHASGHEAQHAHRGDSGAHHAHAHEISEDSSAGTHCPPCVACCAAAAISSLPLIPVPEALTVSVIAAPWLSFSGVLPERLDRPPLAL